MKLNIARLDLLLFVVGMLFIEQSYAGASISKVSEIMKSPKPPAPKEAPPPPPNSTASAPRYYAPYQGSPAQIRPEPAGSSAVEAKSPETVSITNAQLPGLLAVAIQSAPLLNPPVMLRSSLLVRYAINQMPPWEQQIHKDIQDAEAANVAVEQFLKERNHSTAVIHRLSTQLIRCLYALQGAVLHEASHTQYEAYQERISALKKILSANIGQLAQLA
jgi:hypothetical protein